MATQSHTRTCELDGGDSFTGNDTAACNRIQTGNDSSSVTNTNKQPSECPYNSCNMCNKVNNCSWCKFIDIDLYSCMGMHEVSEFGTDCKHTCVANENPCQSSTTCSMCTQQSTCSWCGGHYITLNGGGNYSWGFCSPQNSSQLCFVEDGDFLLSCAPSFLFNNTIPQEVIIDEDPSSIDRMGDPFEDPCTAFSSCSTCMAHSSCGWCSSPFSSNNCLPWGECRGIFVKKNGEYGKQFCLREKGFWRESDCVPDQMEVAAVLEQLSIWDYQNWFLYELSNMTQFGDNFLVESYNTTFLIKLIAVRVHYNISSSLVNVLIFQQVVGPLVPINEDLLVLQCEEMISALWGMVPNPKYLNTKLLSCTGLELQSNRFLTDISIEGTKTDLSNSATTTRVLNWLYMWSVLLVLLT